MSYIGNVPNGAELDARLEYVRYVMQYTNQPIGFEIDTQSSNPKVRIIDRNGNTFTPPTGFYNNHGLWGRIRTCFYKDGVIAYGSNNRGDGKSRTGTDGDVLVEIPTGKIRYEYVDNRYQRFYIIPYSSDQLYYVNHPSVVQRGGTAHSKIYHSAYEASLAIDSSNGNIKLQSIAGVQPFVGGELYKLQFTSGGTTQITIGNVITGGTSTATGTVIATYVSSGTWAGGNAAGYLYLKQVSGTFQTNDALLVSSVDCATASGAASAISLKLSDSETYANNIGTGFGTLNFWTKAYLDILQIIEAGTLDIPSVFGRGIVDLTNPPTGFGGKLTGADDIDSRIGVEGTGVGSGTDGQTSIKWRGIENRYGNVYKHLAGLNVFTDGSYRLLKRDGTGTIAEIMVSGSYETGTGQIPLVDGYISAIQTGELGAFAFIPLIANATGSSSTTYFCDKYFYPTNTNSATFYGGTWNSLSSAGPFFLSNSSTSDASNRALGTFFEYYPQS